MIRKPYHRTYKYHLDSRYSSSVDFKVSRTDILPKLDKLANGRAIYTHTKPRIIDII